LRDRDVAFWHQLLDGRRYLRPGNFVRSPAGIRLFSIRMRVQFCALSGLPNGYKRFYRYAVAPRNRYLGHQLLDTLFGQLA
jgi:hypothetical protein